MISEFQIYMTRNILSTIYSSQDVKKYKAKETILKTRGGKSAHIQRHKCTNLHTILICFFVAGINMIKSNLWRKGFILSCSSSSQFIFERRLEPGTEIQRFLLDCSLWLMLIQISHITPDHLPRGSTASRGLGLPTSINNEANSPKDIVTGTTL